MKRITTYKEYKTLKAIYKNSQIVSVSDSDALIFIRKQAQHVYSIIFSQWEVNQRRRIENFANYKKRLH